ncbi:hypothetical protein ACFQ7F_23855 [Streptomyces sp. NPDC056486]|uniref:hypothetical protein n=1 Tax=Streptomyces sp. NPDC056486 TaxID=3345835 RepID=UPI00369EA647
MRERLDVYLGEFESRFGYPPDSNCLQEVREGGSAAECDDIASVSCDLALLYRHLHRLSLPDVGVGLFVHSEQQTVAGLRGELPTRVTRVTGGAGGVEDSVVVFGSDGGGALFALSRSDSRSDGATVYRLPPGRVDGQTYHCASAVEVLAAGVQGFLTYVEDELQRN